MRKKNKLFVYCCDIAKYRGEGILANNFILILKKIFRDIEVYTPENKFFFIKKKKNHKIINHCFFYKYFTPLFGILKIWMYHCKGNSTAYLNYLPLWNFFLFMFPSISNLADR
jgi:hypothetical protein